MVALGWTLGVTLVVFAVLVALAQLLLPLVARHPQWVAAQLGARIQRPVSFTTMEGRWRPSGPLFVMREVVIGAGPAGGSALRLPQTELQFDLGGWLLPSRHLINLRVQGLRLDLRRDREARWHIDGIGRVEGGGERQNLSLGSLSVGLRLDDLQLEVDDEGAGHHYSLRVDQLRLSHQGRRIRVGAVLRREGASGVWHGAGSFQEDGSAGRLWLAGDAMDLHGLLGDVELDGYSARGGRGNLAVWLDWRHAQVVRATLQADLSALEVKSPSATVAVPGVHGVAALQRTADGYDARWLDDDGGAAAFVLQRPGTAQMRVDLAVRQLQLSPLLGWLALKPGLPPALAQWLGGGHPHGVLEQGSLQWSRGAGLEQAGFDFSSLGIDAVGKLPGLAGLRGELRGDGEALSLSLPGQSTVLSMPHTFRKPFALSRLGGELAAWHDADDGAWHLGTDALAFEGEGYGGEARGEVALPDAGGRPFLDLYAHLDHADVTAAKLFWPVDSMSAAAVNWLDQALVAGQVTAGDVLVRGSLNDWPFRHNEGRFEARAELKDLSLQYGKDWPRADGVGAVAYFVDNGMQVEATAGQSLGNRVEHATAAIPDFAHTVLDLGVQGSGSGASLLDFVRKSPIASRQADVLDKLRLGGSGHFDFHLSLPVADMNALALEGHAQLKQADLDAPAWRLKLDKLDGPLQFTARGVHIGPLQAGFHGQPSSLTMDIADATGRPDTMLSARLAGSYSVPEVIENVPELDWLKPLSSGRSAFTFGFDIARAGSGQDWTQTLSVESDLAGTALNLPVPLAKPAAATLPLRLSFGLPVSGSALQLSLGQVLQGRLRLPTDDGKPLAGTLAFGTRPPDALPEKGLRIRGEAARMDVSGWVQQAVAGASSGSGPGLESVDVRAAQAQVFNRDFPDLRMQVVPKTDVLAIDADSPALAGHFDVPAQDLRRRGVTARLQRLYWPRDDAAASSATAAKDKGGTPAKDKTGAVPAAASTGAAPGTPPADPAATGITPSELPPFHLWVADLRFGEAKLGEARVETWPTAEGMHLDQLRALSRQVQINATGDWNGTAANSHTHLRMDFAADSLGRMFDALGFQGVFEGGKTRVRLDASWPGAPSSLDLAGMDGTLDIDVSNGRILEVAPGVGRLFGLISIGELPRRMTLDFGDVFGKGLAFDAITGKFRLGNGNAWTDDLKIRGPAADITVKGRTGLRARDYDQQLLVVPHVGSSLPIVGAVVAGPVGAAAGLAVQGLLGHGLNRALGSRYFRYTITGSWEKPVMTPLDKRDGMPAAPIPAPGASTPAPAKPGR